MFKNIKVSTMINGGFGAVLLLLLIISFVSYRAMGTSADGFTEYRGLARDTNLSGRLQANMLMVRMNVKDFLITGSDKDKEQYAEYVEKMNGFLGEAKVEIQKPERAKLVKELDGLVGDYEKYFSQVIEFKKQRDALVYDKMDPNGLGMRKALTEIMKSAYKDSDPDAAYYSGRIQEHVLLARLYAAKFLDTNEKSAVERFKKELGPKIDHLATSLDEGLQNPERRRLFKEFMEARKIYGDTFTHLAALIEKRNDIIANQLDRIGPIVAKDVEDIKLSVKADQDALGPVLQANNEKTIRTIIIASIISFLVGIFLAWFTTRSITTPLGGEPSVMADIAKQIAVGDLSMNFDNSKKVSGLYAAMQDMSGSLQERAHLANTIAKGDLTSDVAVNSDKDVLGNALELMSEKLNSMITETQTAAEQIATGAGQVSDASQSLSQGASESAASLEQITSSMTEMAAQTKTNAENSSQANSLAGQAREAAEKGNEHMNNLVHAIEEINESGQNISKIIKVIDEIAFQTNLLALNAAVEAARAGKHGKGFAVVAEEVRNLAARSAKAAQETAELIEGSVEKAKNGSEIAGKTSESLADIVSGATKVTDLVGEIAAASNEQAQGIGQVNQGLNQIEQVTQTNTASAEESAAASEELSSQAHHLQNMMAVFKIKGQGQRVATFDVKRALPYHSESVGKGTQQEEESTSPNPKDVISLDDEEFGKY
jgi:methyl-accepting chemotaxis protein